MHTDTQLHTSAIMIKGGTPAGEARLAQVQGGLHDLVCNGAVAERTGVLGQDGRSCSASMSFANDS